MVIDLDATLVDAHSEEDATRTWKKGFGFPSLMGYVDHGCGGSGEPVAELLRPRVGRVEHRCRPRRRAGRGHGADPRSAAPA